CHTGRPNCFYNAIRDGAVEVISSPLKDSRHDS
ncbi:phosphoribosyl-AMP cyclohydrolase, partial [Pseudomonas sp. SIMBA_077]